MADGTNAELHLFLGRLDGKMDMILSNQTGTNQRLDKHETRIETLEKGHAMAEGGIGTGKQLFTWLISGLALLASLWTLLKGMIHGTG